MKYSRRRSGFTLLELVVTSALMATLITSATVLLRTSQNAWAVAGSEQVKIDSANATLRHLIRQLRQAEGVESISEPTDTSAKIVVRMPDGSQRTWQLTGTTTEYRNGSTGAYTPLANDVDKMIFVGYQADGATATQVPGDIQMVRCTIIVDIFGSQEELTTSVWLRAF